MISITLPTYNEKDNLKPLIEQISLALVGREWEVVVVDDNSQDGTAAEATELAKNYPIRILIRKEERGLGSAILCGFKNSRGDVVGVMDADLQHPPELMRDLLGLIDEGNDIAIASRYVRGGRVEGLSFTRKIFSIGATLLARPLTSVRDPMSGYFFIRRSVIDGRHLDPTGFKILLEILALKDSRTLRVKEAPYTFLKRHSGQSKLGLFEFGRYLKLLCKLYSQRLWRG